MQVGTISFCGRTSLNVKSDDVKSGIMKKLDNLYDLKVIKKHFQLFRPEHQGYINNNPYSVCLRTNGNPYFLCLTQINFCNTCLFIDKKIQQGYYYPRMIIAPFRFHDSLFATDTIFDGEMVKDSNNKWLFIINDLLVNNSVKSAAPLVQRHAIVHDILSKSFMPDTDDICMFQMKKLFKVTHIKEMLDVFMPTLPYTCRGIYFKPLYNKFRDIYYNFDDNNIKSVLREKFAENTFMTKTQVNTLSIMKSNNSVSESASSSSEKGDDSPRSHTSSTDSFKKSQNTIATSTVNNTTVAKAIKVLPEENKTKRLFHIEKTITQDVYRIFNINTGEYVSNACIPSMRISKYLQSLFENSNVVTKHTIEADWSSKFNKWVPVVPE